MEMMHLMNSTGLLIAMVVVLMGIVGEVGLTVSEYLSDHRPHHR